MELLSSPKPTIRCNDTFWRTTVKHEVFPPFHTQRLIINPLHVLVGVESCTLDIQTTLTFIGYFTFYGKLSGLKICTCRSPTNATKEAEAHAETHCRRRRPGVQRAGVDKDRSADMLSTRSRRRHGPAGYSGGSRRDDHHGEPTGTADR